MSEMIRQGDIPGVQLRRRQDLSLPPEEAWRWLVEPDKLVRWLAREARVVNREDGGPQGFLELTDAWQERGRTLELLPPKLWVMAFERLDAGWPAATRLTLRLHRTPAGCQIDVLQEGFQRLPLSAGMTIWEAYRLRWRNALASLAEAAQATQ
jgi:uncharacterized protein YndB with AHSA1/START domain